MKARVKKYTYWLICIYETILWTLPRNLPPTKNLANIILALFKKIYEYEYYRTRLLVPDFIKEFNLLSLKLEYEKTSLEKRGWEIDSPVLEHEVWAENRKFFLYGAGRM